MYFILDFLTIPQNSEEFSWVALTPPAKQRFCLPAVACDLLTFAGELTDLGVGELLHAVAFPGHQPQNTHERLDVADAPRLLLQLLPLGRVVDAGEDVRVGVAQPAVQGLVPGVPPDHLK